MPDDDYPDHVSLASTLSADYFRIFEMSAARVLETNKSDLIRLHRTDQI